MFMKSALAAAQFLSKVGDRTKSMTTHFGVDVEVNSLSK